MEIGLTVPHTGPSAGADHIRNVCQTAEAVGLDCLWAVDHLILPFHTTSPYPLGRAPAVLEDGALARQLAPNFEMITTLSWVAGFTSTIGLGTSVAILAARNPIVNARQVGTLDALSGGRVRFGVGVGWLREEIEALGETWAGRGARAEEHIELLRHLWSAEDETVEFHGRYYDVPAIHPDPRPAQRAIPIILGGHSEIALDRAGRLGDGWIAAPMSPDRLAPLWAGVREAAERAGRDPDSLQLIATSANVAASDLPDLVAAYDAAGVDHLQLRLTTEGDAAIEQVQSFGALRTR